MAAIEPTQLTPYDATKPMTCRACGLSGNHRPTYCNGIDLSTNGARMLGPCELFDAKPPHLHIACLHCGYVWPMGLAKVPE